MAKVYKMPGTLNTGVPLILEDPRASKSNVYLYGIKHDKNSLTPYFDKSIKNFFEVNNVNNTQIQNSSNHYSNNKLYLNKPTTHVQDYYSTSAGNNTSYNFPDESAWMYMDDTLECGVISPITDSTNSATTYLMNNYNHRNSYQVMTGPITEAGEWEDLTNNMPSTDAYYMGKINWLKAASGRVHGFGQYSGSGTSSWSFYPSYMWMSLGGSWPSGSYNSFSYSTSNNITGGGNYYTPQYLGESTVDGSLLIVNTYSHSSSSLTSKVTVTKAVISNASTPTYTILGQNASAEPLAAGSHSGGGNLGNDTFRKNCSHIFTDPRDSDKKAFYYPYFDSYGDFHPFVCTWNTTDDSIAIEEDITITGDKSSIHASLLTETISGAAQGGVSAVTWTANGTRYVGYIPFDMALPTGQGAGMKTIFAYTMDPANPKNLTYHSKIELGSVPRNYVWLNDTRTLLGIFNKDSFEVLAWNDATGWAVTTTVSERVSACGRDSLDRIWYSTNNSTIGAQYQDLNLLSPTLPVTVSIVPENTDNQYTGTEIDTYVNVSAYDTAGVRIAASVKLVIDSASVTFADGSKAKTVTTLTNGELQVATKINGAGYTNITASIQL
jgi:hypothetical protein